MINEYKKKFSFMMQALDFRVGPMTQEAAYNKFIEFYEQQKYIQALTIAREYWFHMNRAKMMMNYIDEFTLEEEKQKQIDVSILNEDE